MSDAVAPLACLNCGAVFNQPTPRFCPECGQESRVRPPRIGEFVQQFGGAYFSTEGALWRTLKLLLLKPGELTRQYLAGRRKHYVLPLRLYLTISVVTLLLVRALAATDVNVGPTVKIDGAPASAEQLQRRAKVSIFGGRAGLDNGQFHCRDLPGWLCKRLQRRIDVDPAAVGAEIEAFKQRLVSNMGVVMFVMLPSFALLLKLAYWNRRLHYTEHLVFALHSHAFVFVMLALTLLQLPWLSALAFLAMPVYMVLALRRVYGGRWWALLLRALAVGWLYGLVFAAALVGLVLWSLVF